MAATGSHGSYYLIRSGRDIHPINMVLPIKGVPMRIVSKKVRKDFVEYALVPHVEEQTYWRRLVAFLKRPVWWW